jgi:hypothetical protein
MNGGAVAVTSSADGMVMFGVPNRRDVTLAAVAAGACVVLTVVALAVGAWLPAAVGAGLLTLIAAVTALRTEIAVMPRLLARRSWWQFALGRDGQMVLFYPGDRIAWMPDGRWLLDGIPLSLPCRDGSCLAEALTAAGLTVDDRRSEWRQAHRRRWAAVRVAVAVCWVACGVAPAAFALGGGALGALTLAGPLAPAAVWLAARPPRTKRQATVTHLPRLAVRPERLAA